MTNVPQRERSLHREIDLRDIIEDLWRQKWLVLLLILTPLLVAGAFVLSRPAVYEVTVKVIAASEKGLAAYNAAARSASDATAGILMRASLARIDPATPNSVLEHLVGNVEAHATGGMEPNAQSSALRARSLERGHHFKGAVHATISGSSVPYAVIRFHSMFREELVSEAQRYVNEMLRLTEEELLEALSTNIALRIADMDGYHELMKKVSLAQASARAARVKEALRMAEEIGLENPPLGGPYFLLTERLPEKSAITHDNLMYLRGAIALRAEAARLDRRMSIEPNMADLPYILRKTEQLKAINIRPELLEIAYIDSHTAAPKRIRRLTDISIPLIAAISGFLVAVLLIAATSGRRGQ